MITLFVLAAAGAVAADTCGYDYYGRYRCSALSNGARLGIGIGIAALALLVFASLVALRRRRTRQINQAYITNPNQGPYQPYPNQPYPPQQYQPQPSYDPTYYPNQNGAWNSGAPVNNYPTGQQAQYAPPPGPPPAAAPPGYYGPDQSPRKEHP